MKLAIVHDYLNQFGGAERVVASLHRAFPEAPIYTSIYDYERMPEEFRSMDIRTTFMQRLPGIMEHYKPYLPFYPIAFNSLDLKGYDVILSSSSAFAKGVKKPENALHICYCHNPMRFVWRYDDYIRDEGLPFAARVLLSVYLRRLKMWDVATSSRVDHFIANSVTVARRILECWGRDSTVINPPVETSKFSISPKIDDYYLIVSRLRPYKRIELAIEAFNRMRKPLKIIGEGAYGEKLKKFAGDTIEFLGALPDPALAQYYSRCRALVFPGEEDFGIAPVEAMASGRPVVAYGRGGALETVIEGYTGVFFNEQTPQAVIDAVKRLEAANFDPSQVRAYAMDFDSENFKSKLVDFVKEKYAAFRR